MNSTKERAFDFGENWSNFSVHALTAARVAQSRLEFAELMAEVPLAGASFLDIGFGQGLSLLAAASAGASAYGCDINPKCADVLASNSRWFPGLAVPPAGQIGSILDEIVVEQLRAARPGGGYDIVHSWGVLHHTGDMKRAIRHAAGLVASHGFLVLAIYNRHWSSPLWRSIKRGYVASPRWLQRASVGLFCPVIFFAKWLVTRRDPREQQRGMDFYYNVIDWVGGYPYEYASREEMVTSLATQGFQLVKFRASQVPTGCNEFIFRREA